MVVSLPTVVLGQVAGDATADGLLDARDLVAISNEIAGLAPTPGISDCNLDGRLNHDDVVCVRQIILSQISSGPVIDSLAPDSVPAGSVQLSLTVRGEGFADGAAVRLDGVTLATTFVDATEVSATVPAVRLAAPGLFPVQVVNADGKASFGALLSVRAPPGLDALVPSGVAAGSPSFTLTLSGQGFLPTSVAVLDSVDLATTFIGSGMLTALVPASLVATPGTGQVHVRQSGNTNALPLRRAALTLTGFSPNLGPVGTEVTLTGTGLDLPPRVAFAARSGGQIEAPILSNAPGTLRVQVPAGAASGNVTLISGGLNLAGPVFTVTTRQTYGLSAGPPNAVLFPSHSATYAISATSPDGFTGRIDLTVSGLPAGVNAAVQPPQITPGQTATLTLSASSAPPLGPRAFTVTGTASIEGQTVVATVGLALDVQPVTTSFWGRAVSADAVPVPLQGVTVRFHGRDDQGNPTGCAVPAVQTDFAGNYAFYNLPSACTGTQLVGYDGLTATQPAGQLFAGVNLRWNIVPGQVTVAAPRTHLVRIDTAETVAVAQNAGSTQVFTFDTIPGLRVEVYPGTVLTMPDGSTPDPFELIAVRVPVDRLPDEADVAAGEIVAFVVAFQPAEAFASQPVAVDYPNIVATPPGTSVGLFTLDPERGFMVLYGTGTVSGDGLSIVADEDPGTPPGRRFGITHFDWHGPRTQTPPGENRVPTGGENGSVVAGECVASGSCVSTPAGCGSVEYATGAEAMEITDAAVTGIVLPTAFVRIYRSDLVDFEGPFGRGSSHSFNYSVLAGQDTSEALVELSLPNGGRVAMTRQPDGTYVAPTRAFARGSVLRWDGAEGSYRLEALDGSTLFFTPAFALSESSSLTAIEDRHGNRVELVRGLGLGNVEVLRRIVATNGEEITLEYDGQNRIRKLTDPAGRDTLYDYDVDGRLLRVTDPLGGETLFDYDAEARLTSVTDARGITVVAKSYDAAGRVVREVFPDGGEVTYAYTLANPNDPESPVITTRVTDARGNATIYRFTVDGVLTDITDALGQTVSFTVDPVTGRYLERRGLAGCRLCGNRAVGDQTFEYDALGRLTRFVDALGGSTTLTYPAVGTVPETIVDALGRLTTFQQNAVGDITSIVDPAGTIWAFTYDTAGRPLATTDPNNNTTSFSYGADGRLESVADPLNRVTAFGYDAAGRLATTTLADGTTERLAYDALDRVARVEDGLGQLIRFTYDEVGNLRTVTDSRGNTTEFVYDDSPQQIVREIAADGTERIARFDVNDNLVSLTDRDGRTANFTYDELDRLVLSIYEDGSIVELEWDAAGRLLSADDKAGGRVERTFDASGQLISEASPSGRFSFVYDSIGRRISREGPDGITIYSYKAQGQLGSVSNDSATVQFEYDASGQLIQSANPAGAEVDYVYDEASQLTRIDFGGPAGFSDFRSYTYDARGRIVSISGGSLSTPFILPQSASFDSANRLISLNGRDFHYDMRGRLLWDGIRTYEWTDRGSLLRTMGPEGETVYSYDALGRRFRKIENNLPVIYLYDGLDVARIVKESSSTDFLRGLALDDIWAERSEGVTRYLFRDHSGSVVAAVDPEGSVEIVTYDEYGMIQGEAGLHFGYIGREHDHNNLVYLRARYYLPEIGRFASEDPIGLNAGDVNLYRYASNNPVIGTDPLGLQVRGTVFDVALDAMKLFRDMKEGEIVFGGIARAIEEAERKIPFGTKRRVVVFVDRLTGEIDSNFNGFLVDPSARVPILINGAVLRVPRFVQIRFEVEGRLGAADQFGDVLGRGSLGSFCPLNK